MGAIFFLFLTKLWLSAAQRWSTFWFMIYVFLIKCFQKHISVCRFDVKHFVCFQLAALPLPDSKRTTSKRQTMADSSRHQSVGLFIGPMWRSAFKFSAFWANRNTTASKVHLFQVAENASFKPVRSWATSQLICTSPSFFGHSVIILLTTESTNDNVQERGREGHFLLWRDKC